MLYGGVPSDTVVPFTLHSLMCTFLAWAEEADASSKDRCAQGHHAKPGVSGTVPKYSRNDTLAQLRCQQHVWEKIEAGGRPMVPIDRGVSGHIILPSSSTATQRACVDGVQNTLPPSTDDDIEPSLNDAAQRDGSTTEEEEEHDDDYSSVCLSDTLDVDDSEEEIFDSGNVTGPGLSMDTQGGSN